MKNYSGMTNEDLTQEIDKLQTTIPVFTKSKEAQTVPTTEELQGLLDELQQTQSSNFLVYSTLNAMQRLLHELELHQVELELQNRELRKSRHQLEESHHRYADLYHCAPYGYLTFDKRGYIQESNLTAARLLGLSRSSLVGLSFVGFLAPGQSPLFLDYLERYQDGADNGSTELRLKNGRTVQLQSPLWRDEARAAPFIRTALVDISERKRTEEALRASEARFRHLADTSPVMIWMSGPDKLCYFFNKPWLNFTGRTMDEEQGNGWAEGVHPEDYDGCLATYTRAFEARIPFEMEYRLRRADGAYRWVVDHGAPYFSPQGDFLGYVGSCIDIQERRHADEAVRASEARTAGIIESAMDAIMTVDAEQRIILFNNAAEQMFQCSAAEAIGQPLDRFIPERFRQGHHQHITDFGQTQVTKRAMGALGAIYGLRANGEEFPIEASISQIKTSGQQLFTVILRDITQRKYDEARLEEQAALLNEAQDAIISRNQEGRVTFWNRGAERIYGWTSEEMIGRNIGEALFRESIEQLEERNLALRTKGVWQGELRQFTKAGQEVTVESRQTLLRDTEGKLCGLLVINTDISEKKQIEAQFLQSQRMENLGTLASGIAHDLSNLLAPVLMGVEMLQMKFSHEMAEHWLGIMRNNIQHSTELIKQVLLFASGVQGKRVSLQPKHLLREAINILSEVLPKSIEIKYSIPENLALITGDATQFYQVLMNLCVNARDAMPHGGELWIEAANMPVDELYAASLPNARPGSYVQITIRDTGVGIPDEIKGKIFAPFFTTKEVGKGTGLGLSTVLGIVKNHDGFLTVSSAPGHGTTFRVYWPAYSTARADQSALPLAELPRGNGEMILVVDDEAAICEITRSMLEAFGYQVLTARDGTGALMLYAAHRSDIQVVLTDLMMPYLDGPRTIRALRKMTPNLKVIASSGLSEQENLNEVAALGVKYFLAKPYTAEQLVTTIAQILRAEESSASQAIF